jgi:hypothetical protein
LSDGLSKPPGNSFTDKTTFEREDNTRKKGDIDKRNDMGQTQSDAIDANRLLAVTKDRLWSKDDPSV